MDEDSKALRALKRICVVWPLLALPFIPAAGKMIAGFVLVATLANGALQ